MKCILLQVPHIDIIMRSFDMMVCWCCERRKHGRLGHLERPLDRLEDICFIREFTPLSSFAELQL